MKISPEKEIDVRMETCPMTTVYVRLALDGLPSGARLGVTLSGAEPHRNVAAAVRMLGHTILEDRQVQEGKDDYRLVVAKS